MQSAVFLTFGLLGLFPLLSTFAVRAYADLSVTLMIVHFDGTSILSLHISA
jgi:hypothetical protein